MTNVSGDHWTLNYPLAGNTYDIELTCGSQQSGCTSMSIRGQSKAIIYQEPHSLDSTLHKYQFFSYDNLPDAYPSGFNYFTLLPGFTPPSVLYHAWAQGYLVSSLTLNWGSFVPDGYSMIYMVFQHGTDASGGTLADPPVFSGGSIKLASPTHRVTLIHVPSLPHGTTVTIPTSSASDITMVAGYVIAGTFTGTLQEHNQLQSQPATLNPAITLATPAHTPGIQTYGIWTWRAAPTSATVPAPNVFTIMDLNNGPGNANIVGGTPVYEGAGMCNGAGRTGTFPITNFNCHTISAEKFDAMCANMT